MLKLCSRVCRFDKFDDPVAIFREASDCLSGHVRKSEERLGSMLRLAENLNVNKEKVLEYIFLSPSIDIAPSLHLGPILLPNPQAIGSNGTECASRWTGQLGEAPIIAAFSVMISFCAPIPFCIRQYVLGTSASR